MHRRRRTGRGRHWIDPTIGMGVLILEAKDFPRDERTRLAAAIETSLYLPKMQAADRRDLALQLHGALVAPNPMMEALRQHLGVDGHELRARVRKGAALIPDLKALAAWV